MPKAYEVEGTRYEFPDNFTDAQAQDILTKQGIIKPPNPNRASAPIEQGASVGGFVQNALSSAGNMVGDAAKAVMHPIDTLGAAADTVGGGIIKGLKAVGVPGELDQQQEGAVKKFDSISDHYRERYGSLKGIAKTLYEDPVGAAMDASVVLEGGGAALRGAGAASKSSALVKAGEAVSPVRAGTAAAGKVAEVGKQGVQAAKQAVFKPPTPSAAMLQALKPASNNLRFTADVNKVLPEIKAAEQAIGKPISSVEDMAEAVKAAKKNIWSQYEQIAGGKRATQIDLTPVADAMEKSIPSKLKLEDPRAAAALLDRADKYRGTFSVQDAEEILRSTNAELDSYFGKYPSAQRTALRGNPDTALLDAQGKALRDTIYNHLDQPGQGAAPRELMRRYGSLLNVEHEIERRINVAARQAPESLSQQLGKWQAAGEAARGAGRILMGDLGGAADLAGAVAKRKAADWLKRQNTSDQIIKNTFANLP
jgi:hypothetical protein